MAPFKFTIIGLFSCMCSYVYRQCASLDETLIAVFRITVVRSLVGMDSVMPAEIGFAIE